MPSKRRPTCRTTLRLSTPRWTAPEDFVVVVVVVAVAAAAAVAAAVAVVHNSRA